MSDIDPAVAMDDLLLDLLAAGGDALDGSAADPAVALLSALRAEVDPVVEDETALVYPAGGTARDAAGGNVTPLRPAARPLPGAPAARRRRHWSRGLVAVTTTATVVSLGGVAAASVSASGSLLSEVKSVLVGPTDVADGQVGSIWRMLGQAQRALSDGNLRQAQVSLHAAGDRLAALPPASTPAERAAFVRLQGETAAHGATSPAPSTPTAPAPAPAGTATAPAPSGTTSPSPTGSPSGSPSASPTGSASPSPSGSPAPSGAGELSPRGTSPSPAPSDSTSPTTSPSPSPTATADPSSAPAPMAPRGSGSPLPDPTSDSPTPDQSSPSSTASA